MTFKERQLYIKLTWDNENGKKKLYMGKKWGELEKDEANGIAYKTGNGLVVVDVDNHDLDCIDKKLGDSLKKLTPTVTTKRGYHYYFMYANSAEFINDSAYSEFVDVRSDGGIIIAQYQGRSDLISYKRTGKVYQEIPKKLLKRLQTLRTIKKNTKKTRNNWSEAPKGEIHSATLSYAGKDFHSGMSFDEVMYKGVEYVEAYLGGKPREMKLMSTRIKDAYNYFVENRIEDAVTVESHDIENIGGDFEEAELVGILVNAHKKGALELEKTMKMIKHKTKISIATLKDMLLEAQSGGKGFNGFFQGELVWDDRLGCYCDVCEDYVVKYKKAVFTQTVMSRTGYMAVSDVNDKLCEIPHKRIAYRPDKRDAIEFIDDEGVGNINCYRGVNFGEKGGKKIPKLINKLLDSLFENDIEAKDYFIQWLAYIVQTGKRSGVAWGFFGASGTGKGLMVDVIMRLLGINNCSINVSDTSLQSDFNSYLESKQFVHLNEIAGDFHSRHGVAGKIKAMISDPFMMLNTKGVSEYVIPNFANVILNSNKPNPIEIDIDDRRWNMIIANTPLISLDWFTQGVTGDKILEESMKFGNYLMNLELNFKMATHIMPKSIAKENVIAQTTNPLQELGNYVKSGAYNDICDLLELDGNEIEIDLKDLELSCKEMKWSNILLGKLYANITGKSQIHSNVVSRYFIRPYITATKCTVERIGKNLTRLYYLA